MTELPADEVHVWHARLDDAELLALSTSMLSPEEWARAERFHFERDRRRFRAARGLLRTLLEAYCGVSAGDLAFAYSPFGKPALAAPASDLQFNLSHSHELAAVAFVRSRRVGIDVEQLRDVQDAEGLVARYFAAEEASAYRALPAESRRRGFFSGWTRKEAFIKALGEGLSCPLDSFAVSLDEPARILRARAESVADWLLCELPLGPDYVAALAVDAANLRVRVQSWP